MYSLTPSLIQSLEPGEVFVFETDLNGRHDLKDAQLAVRLFGARPGCGFGPMGNSFAIPTFSSRRKVLPLDEIRNYVRRFVAYSLEHPERHFLVRNIGCGVAGYPPEQMASMFADAPSNVALPVAFWSVLSREINKI